MNVSLDYNGKQYEFPLWTNKLEKEILLSISKSMSCEDNINNVFPLINIHKELENIHYIDKLYIFMRCREYSIGNVINNIISCGGCKHPQSLSYKISDNFVFRTSPSEIQTEFGIVRFTNNSVTLDDVLLEDIEDLNKIIWVKKNILEKDEHSLSIVLKHNCQCGNVNNIRHDENSILHDIIVSMDVGEMYKYYVNMQYNYRMSFADLDNMYSFERNIYVNLYDTMNKERKANSNQ